MASPIMLWRHEPRLRAAAKRRRRLTKLGGFIPTQVSALTAWHRAEASVPDAGEWAEIFDVLGGASLLQTDADRRPADGLSANGLATMVFDGTDVLVWALNASTNNRTDKLGFWLWFKPSVVNTIQRLINITIAAGASVTFEKLSFYTLNAQLRCEVYISNANGRNGTTTSNVLTAGAWHSIYLQYDSSRGGDSNLAIFVNGTSAPLTFTNIGAGGTLGALQSPTGNCIIGGFNNTDTPTQPIDNLGELGPNFYTFNDNLTAGQIAAFDAFERPT